MNEMTNEMTSEMTSEMTGATMPVRGRGCRERAA